MFTFGISKPVVMSDINTRLKELMDEHELSPAAFAEKLNIQRSGLSHILNGRNKPSLDFVLKLMSAFPELDSNWLLTGENKPVPPPRAAFSGAAQRQDPLIRESEDAALYNGFPRGESRPDSGKKKEDTIQRIVIFYTDSTFETFTPHA